MDRRLIAFSIASAGWFGIALKSLFRSEFERVPFDALVAIGVLCTGLVVVGRSSAKAKTLVYVATVAFAAYAIWQAVASFNATTAYARSGILLGLILWSWVVRDTDRTTLPQTRVLNLGTLAFLVGELVFLIPGLRNFGITQFFLSIICVGLAAAFVATWLHSTKPVGPKGDVAPAS